jgi:hypothetical protein
MSPIFFEFKENKKFIDHFPKLKSYSCKINKIIRKSLFNKVISLLSYLKSIIRTLKACSLTKINESNFL